MLIEPRKLRAMPRSGSWKGIALLSLAKLSILNLEKKLIIIFFRAHRLTEMSDEKIIETSGIASVSDAKKLILITLI